MYGGGVACNLQLATCTVGLSYSRTSLCKSSAVHREYCGVRGARCKSACGVLEKARVGVRSTVRSVLSMCRVMHRSVPCEKNACKS